ncbi:MAG: hypothetical protein AAFP19_14440 [Bacteroidota bacterium]
MARLIDEAFLPLSEMIEELSDWEGQMNEVFEKERVRMEIESARLELPVELDIVVNEEGKVELGAVTPLYDVSTSFNPVFHQIRIGLVAQKPSEISDSNE